MMRRRVRSTARPGRPARQWRWRAGRRRRSAGNGPSDGCRAPRCRHRLGPTGFDGRERRSRPPPVLEVEVVVAAAAANSSSASPNASSWNWWLTQLPTLSCRRGSRGRWGGAFVGHGGAGDGVGRFEVGAVGHEPFGHEADRLVEQRMGAVGGDGLPGCSTGRGSRRSGSRSCDPASARSGRDIVAAATIPPPALVSPAQHRVGCGGRRPAASFRGVGTPAPRPARSLSHAAAPRGGRPMAGRTSRAPGRGGRPREIEELEPPGRRRPGRRPASPTSARGSGPLRRSRRRLRLERPVIRCGREAGPGVKHDPDPGWRLDRQDPPQYDGRVRVAREGQRVPFDGRVGGHPAAAPDEANPSS